MAHVLEQLKNGTDPSKVTLPHDAPTMKGLMAGWVGKATLMVQSGTVVSSWRHTGLLAAWDPARQRKAWLRVQVVCMHTPTSTHAPCVACHQTSSHAHVPVHPRSSSPTLQTSALRMPPMPISHPTRWSLTLTPARLRSATSPTPVPTAFRSTASSTAPTPTFKTTAPAPLVVIYSLFCSIDQASVKFTCAEIHNSAASVPLGLMTPRPPLHLDFRGLRLHFRPTPPAIFGGLH